MADGTIGTRSVLFTDLVGSTELRVRLGEEDADALRRAHDGLLTEAVTTHGGTVVKGLGDGIMATFESAADAVAASVAIQQAAHGHSRRQPDQAFSVRVGVSIGDVSTEGGDVFGVPVVEGSRLCAIATGGEILVAELVRALARGRGGFLFEPMGEVELKGLPEPVQSCRVVWEPLAPERAGDGGSEVPMPPPLLGAATGYVGRETLRDRLGQEWQHARSGGSRTVLLAGEPGVGKTRTAAEVARAAHADGANVLYGRCDEDLGMPFQPFVEALQHYVAHASSPRLGRFPGELSRLFPDLGSVVPGLPPPVLSDPASEEFRLFEATASWINQVAQEGDGGLVLVLDDIHWATKPTLQLMAHLVRSAHDEGASLLVLATYRDTDIDRAHPLSTVLGDLRRLPGVERIAVENLSNGEVVAFITMAAGHELDAPTLQLAEAIHAETEGNPFFVGEVLRHLIETGGVKREGDHWVVSDPGHVAVPEGVRDVVGRRLSRLSARANEVLTTAAVVGREFEVDVLLALVEGTEDMGLDALDEAVRARLVEETSVEHYRFAHALVRTTLYEELSATRRRRLHRRVADLLEKMRPHDVRALAYHCTEGGPDGGDVERAVRYTLAAAEEALALKAFAEAEVRFGSALELLEDSEEREPAEMVAALCGLGQSQRDQANPEFRQTLLDASRRAVELEHTPLLVRAVLANSRGFASLIGGVDAERVELIEEALARIGPAPSRDRARLLALLAEEVTFMGDHPRRLAMADEAEAMARSTGDDELLCTVLCATGFSSFAPDRSAGLVERGREAKRLADASGDPTRRVLARVFLSGALQTVGEAAAAAAEIGEMVAIAESEGAPHIVWTAHFNALRLVILAGRLDEAAIRNDELLLVGQDLGQPDADPWWAGVVVGLSWLRGHLEPLADSVGAFAALYPQSMTWQTSHVWVLSQVGRLKEAREVIEAHALTPTGVIGEAWPYHPASMLAYASWALHDVAMAADAVVALAPYRDRWAHYYLFALGPVTWPLGLALAGTGAYDEALSTLGTALEQMGAAQLAIYNPRIRLDLAAVLLRRGGPGDSVLAAEVLAQARAEAVELDATGLVDRIDTLAV